MSRQNHHDRPVLTTHEASIKSGLTREYLSRLLQAGRIEGTKPWGNQWMVYEDSLMAFLSSLRSPGRKSGRQGPRKKSIIGKNGHVHLSTSLASERYGYAQNYLLELRRADLIIGEKRGRDWYIDEDSLVAYKLSKHPDFIIDSTLAPPLALTAPASAPGQPTSSSTEPQAPAPSEPELPTEPLVAEKPDDQPADATTANQPDESDA